MKVILVSVILGALMIEANGYNDDEMKAKVESMEKRLSKMTSMENQRAVKMDAMEKRLAKMDSMEKRLAKMDAMEKRLAVVEQQEGKGVFTFNWSKYDDEKRYGERKYYTPTNPLPAVKELLRCLWKQ